MDTIGDPLYEIIVFMTAAQVGKTTIIENIIGYYIEQDPAPILVVQPTEKMGETFSEDRLSPMIRDTDVLNKIFGESKTRKSKNKILHKKFLGGHITIGGSNSPASLASRPIRILIAEEVDRWPASAGSEGDPLALAIKRTQTFWNKKIVINSTPTIKDASRIEYWYKLSDRRVYEVPCLMCKEYQELKWDNIKWDKDDKGNHLPETAVYVCKCCGAVIEEKDKAEMVKLGKWVKKGTSKGIAGFNINELYSPWSSWAEMVSEFLKVKNDPEKFKVFVNTSWAQSFELRGDAPDWKRLYARREKYDKGTVPEGGLIITAGVDIQGDRAECDIIAWGRNNERWSIDYRVIPGNPEKVELWEKISNLFDETFKHEKGFNMNIRLMAVDSGYSTTEVYMFGRQQGDDRVMVIRGKDSQNTILSKPTPIDIKKDGKVIYRGVRLWNIGINIAKNEIYSRLRLEKKDEGFPSGYIHHPDYDEEYFKQLTAEQSIRQKTKTGFYRYSYVRTYTRNEVLDCNVYARGAAAMLGIDRFTDQYWDKIEKILGTITEKPAKKKKRGQLSKGINI